MLKNWTKKQACNKVFRKLFQKLKDVSCKTVIVDAIFGIGGRIDLGSKLKEIVSDCDRFESKIRKM